MGGWLQVEFLKCSISEMTNSLFEKGETKMEGRGIIIKGAERERERDSPLVFSLSRELRPLHFPQLTVFWTRAADLQRQREQGLLRLQQLMCTLAGRRRRRRGGGVLILKRNPSDLW